MELGALAFLCILRFAILDNTFPIITRHLKTAISLKEFKKELGLPQSEEYADKTLVVYPTVALEGDSVRRCFEDLMIQILFNYFRD